MTFRFPLRIYMENTDAGGVVYYANYLNFFERARTEFLRSIGIEQSIIMPEKIIFVVKRAQIDYKIPARLDDLTEVSCTVKMFRPTRITFAQEIRRAVDQAILCNGEVEVVTVNMNNLRPVAIPDSIRIILKNELESSDV